MDETRVTPSPIATSLQLPDELKGKLSDFGPPTFAAIISLMPHWGPIGALVSALVPNLRLERVSIYLANLGERVRQIEDALRLGTAPKRLQLFLDGGDAAMRAASTERAEQIARLVADGVSKDEKFAERTRILLSILDELTDTELALLMQIGPDRSAAEGMGLDVPLLSACMARLRARGLVRRVTFDGGHWGDDAGIDKEADLLEFSPNHYATTAFGAEIVRRITP